MAYVPPVNGYVPPVNNTPPTRGPQGSCRTAGCRFDGHRDNGFMCSSCGRGWTPQRLAQRHELAKEAEADARARYFVDWDEPGVTFAPHEYEQLRRAVESWAADRAGKPDSFGVMTFISNLLLESHRLLTPEQARELWRAVEPMVLNIHDQVGWRARTKFIMLLASFLGSPARWCRIPYSARFEFWPDEADGCAWDSATPASLLEVRTSLPGDMRRRNPERLPPLEK